MSDVDENIFNLVSESCSIRQSIKDTSKTTSYSAAPATDFADAVNLFNFMLDTQFASLSQHLKSEQKANAQQLSKKPKENAGSKLRGEGNKIQYSFNVEIPED